MEDMTGRTIIDVIKEFSDIEWLVEHGEKDVKTTIKRISILTAYHNEQKNKIVQMKLDRKLERHINEAFSDESSSSYLMSLVQTKKIKYAHIPMLQMDFSSYDNPEELLPLAKDCIRSNLHIHSGVFFCPGEKAVYDLMALGRIMDRTEYYNSWPHRSCFLSKGMEKEFISQRENISHIRNTQQFQKKRTLRRDVRRYS